MSILVEYVCRACRSRSEVWASSPADSARACTDCGGQAKRTFGGSLLKQTDHSLYRSAQAPPTSYDSCQDHHNLPGGCVLTPTAARALQARARSDNSAIDQEFAYQERAMKDGTLDPETATVRPSPAHPTGPTGR